MTNSRSLITRYALPLAATALVLTACGSSTATDDAKPAAATSAAEAMASSESDAMESDSMESEAMESEAMESEAMESDSMDSMASDDMSSAEAEPAAASSGAYITLTDYQGSKDMYDNGDVVLFFAADWCPTCQEATANLEADPAAIPAGLTIVRVDYDNSDELKQKYGITTQHTFVQVDAAGNELAKWTGSVTADEIEKQTT